MWNVTDGFSLEYWKDVESSNLILRDQVRIDSFRRAINEVVQKGDIVLDLGSGLGLMSILAARAGAKKVYGIEYHQNLIEEAKKRIKEEELEDKIDFIHGLSIDINEPSIEPVDVIISETLGFMGIGENIFKYVTDARKKWLKKQGRVIPAVIELYIAPALVPQYRDEPYTQMMCDIRPEHLVGDPECLARFDLQKDESVSIREKPDFHKNGRINGFAGWFKAFLTEDVVLDTSPYSPQTCWHQMFYPINHNRAVEIQTIEKEGLITLDVR